MLDVRAIIWLENYLQVSVAVERTRKCSWALCVFPLALDGVVRLWRGSLWQLDQALVCPSLGCLFGSGDRAASALHAESPSFRPCQQLQLGQRKHPACSLGAS